MRIRRPIWSPGSPLDECRPRRASALGSPARRGMAVGEVPAADEPRQAASVPGADAGILTGLTPGFVHGPEAALPWRDSGP